MQGMYIWCIVYYSTGEHTEVHVCVWQVSHGTRNSQGSYLPPMPDNTSTETAKETCCHGDILVAMDITHVYVFFYFGNMIGIEFVCTGKN